MWIVKIFPCSPNSRLMLVWPTCIWSMAHKGIAMPRQLYSTQGNKDLLLLLDMKDRLILMGPQAEQHLHMILYDKELSMHKDTQIY